MSVMSLVAGLAGIALAVFGVFRMGQRRSGQVDLGTVSDQWRAQQRANPSDSGY